LDVNEAAKLRQRYFQLIDTSAVEAQRAEEVDGTLDSSELRRSLAAIFAHETSVEEIMLRIRGHDIGVATRARVGRDLGHAGTTDAPFDPGSSEGATLPGAPSQFRVLQFRCAKAGCDDVWLRSFYDSRDLPVCAAHGRTVLAR
jgi:hypothetical protein